MRSRAAGRLTARLILLTSALLLMGGGALAEEMQLLQREGALFSGKKAKPVPEKRKTFLFGTALRAGPAIKAGQLKKRLAKPPADTAAFLLAPGQVVTLSTGASVRARRDKQGRLTLTLSGAAHILLAADSAKKKGSAITLSLGGLTLKTSRAHLFYNGWAKPARLSVVSGEAVLVGRKAAIKKAEKGQPRETDKIGQGKLLALGKDGPTLETPTKEDERMRRWAELPGFQTPGPYNRVGDAVPSDERLLVTRYERELALRGKAIAVFEGDKLRTKDPQKVLIRFDNSDRIKLFGNTTFHIQRHTGARKKKENLLFRMFGKMRALLTPRGGPANIRFNSATATIGVKGTDLETLASAGNTEVSVVDGLLGVANPAGLGEVDVPAGMFTTVAEGQLPTPPQPIPPEKLEQLRAEGIVAESVSISSPSDGQVLRTASITYAVVPPSAPVEVLLDGSAITASSGSPLPALDDGQHRLTVKAAGADGPAQTVTFTVDTTAPAPAKEVKLAELTFTPGKPLVLSWQEPLQSVEVNADGQAIPAELSKDGTRASLKPDPKLFKGDKPLGIQIKAVDRAGNEAVLEGAVRLRVAKPPKVSIGTGKPELQTEKLGSLKITADRGIARWTVLLDGRDISKKVLPPKKPKQKGKQKLTKQIVLPASVFAKLKPGPHKLTVKAADRKNLEGTASLSITLLAPAPPKPKPKAVKRLPMPGKSLKERYEGSIARDTGYALDEMYLNMREGFFATPGFEKTDPEEPPRKDLYPKLPPYEAGFLRALEDPYFRRHSVETEEGTPIPLPPIDEGALDR